MTTVDLSELEVIEDSVLSVIPKGFGCGGGCGFGCGVICGLGCISAL